MRIGYVYKIIYLGEEPVLPYVGSTWTTLPKRFACHKRSFVKWKDGLGRSCSIFPFFEAHGIENFEIIELEKYSIEDKTQLRLREQDYIDKIECCNKRRAVLNPNYYIEYGAKYREQNKEKESQRKKEYSQRNREVIAGKMKEYTQLNKEVLVQKRKEYREHNKDQISEKKKQRSQCDTCNISIRREDIRRHERSIRHQDNLASQ